MLARLCLSSVVGAVSLVLVATNRNQPEPRRASAEFVRRLADPVEGDWKDVTEGADELSSLKELLAAELARAVDAVGPWPNNPLPATNDAIAVLAAWIESDGSAIEAARGIDGLALSRDVVETSIERAVGWGYLPERPPDWIMEASDADLLQELLDAQDKSGFIIRGVDTQSVEVGFGISVPLGSEEWPIRAMDVTLSHHAGAAGPIPDPDAIEDTPKTLHVRFRVLLEDGEVGLIRFGYWYDDRCHLWIPVAAASSVFSGPHTCRTFAF